MTNDHPASEDDLIHFLKNQLSIVLGFTHLLLEDVAEEDRMRGDLEEIRQAADAALARIPELARRLAAAGGHHD